jgi:hypothetical protein
VQTLLINPWGGEDKEYQILYPLKMIISSGVGKLFYLILDRMTLALTFIKGIYTLGE